MIQCMRCSTSLEAKRPKLFSDSGWELVILNLKYNNYRTELRACRTIQNTWIRLDVATHVLTPVQMLHWSAHWPQHVQAPALIQSLVAWLFWLLQWYQSCGSWVLVVCLSPLFSFVFLCMITKAISVTLVLDKNSWQSFKSRDIM